MSYEIALVIVGVAITLLVIGILVVQIKFKEFAGLIVGVLLGMSLVYWVIYEAVDTIEEKRSSNTLDYNVIDDKEVVGSIDIKKLIEDGVEYIDYKVEDGKVVIDIVG